MNPIAAPLTESQINAVLAPASIFKDDFSIDWLIHITGKKPSNILEILEIATIHGVLIKSDFSHFRFSNPGVQTKFKKSLRVDQITSIHKKLTDLLSNNKTDDKETPRLISGYLPETDNDLKILKNALERAKKRKNTSATAVLQMHIAKNEWYHANYGKALDRFQAGMREVNSSDDPALFRSTRVFRLFFNFWQGNFSKAVAIHADNMLKTEAIPHDSFHLMAESAAGICYLMTGEMARGIGMINAIGSRCCKPSDPFVDAFNKMMMACSLIDIYRINESFGYIQQAAKASSNKPQGPISIYCHLLYAYVHYINKNSQLAIKYLKKFLSLRTLVPQMVWPFAHMLKLCQAIELGHLPPVDGISLRKEIECSLKTKNPFLIGIALRYEAFLQQKNQASPKNIYRLLRESVKWLEKTGHLIELNRTRHILINQYLLDGKKTMAKQIQRSVAVDLSKIPQSVIPDDLKPLVEKESAHEHQRHCLFFLSEWIMEIESDNIIIYQLLNDTCRIIGAERGAIFLAVDSNDDASGFSLFFSNNMTDAQLMEPAFDFANKTIQAVIQTGKKAIKTKISASATKEPITSLICLPLKLKGKAIGAIYHDNRFIPPAFTDENVTALKYVAALMTLVIEKQRLARKLETGKKNADQPSSGSSFKNTPDKISGQNFKPKTIDNTLKINRNTRAPKKEKKTVLSLKNVERNHIMETLKLTGGKIRGTGGAAELMDIHPSTLYSRMNKLGIRTRN